MKLDPATPIREIALALPGATTIFERVGLDYCCAGSASLASACRAAGLSLESVLASLDDASQAAGNVASFHDWRAERKAAVAAHLVDHNYVVEREKMADTSALMAKVVSVHGASHPELREIATLWADLCGSLRAHLHYEGKELEPLKDDAEPTRDSVKRMKAFHGQHEEVVALAHRIRVLTDNYHPPSDACEALESLYRDLETFEADLHEHVLLADNVLFRD